MFGADGLLEAEHSVGDAARAEPPLTAGGQAEAAERGCVLVHPLAVAAEDVGDLGGAQQTDPAARRPGRFG